MTNPHLVIRRGPVLLLALGLAVAPAAAWADHATPWAALGEASGAATAAGDATDAAGHLARLMELSPAPEYRRFGTAGMAAVADHAAAVLDDAGYAVVRPETTFDHWQVDYRAGHEPLLERIDTGETFVVESAFGRRATDGTLPDLSTGTDGTGLTCTVVPAAEVAGPQHCGLVPFDSANPEWNNFTANARAVIDDIAAAGGSGVVVQGDAERDMVFAQQVRTSIPTIVAAVDDDDVVGHQVRLRVEGTWRLAEVHNVVGVLPERTPGAGYLAVMGHADAWFQGAVDNGAGTAAVLDAAEALARLVPVGADGPGVVVALFDAEEVGLVGSAHVAALLESESGLVIDDGLSVRMDQIIGVVNLDAPSGKPSDVHGHDEDTPMASHGVPVFSWRALVFSDPFPASQSHQPYVDAAVSGAQFVTTFGSHGVYGLPAPSSAWKEFSGGWRTDAQHFHEAGIPVVWPVAGYPEYHTNLDLYDPTGDRYSTVDPVDLQAVADATVDWVLAH